MKRLIASIIALPPLAAPMLVAALLTAPAFATPGGPLGVLQIGTYICELPGDATGPAGLHQESANFDVINASSYRNAKGRGTYLKTGDIVVMTSGPKRGERYHQLSDNFLRRIGPDGSDSDLRCVRRVPNNR